MKLKCDVHTHTLYSRHAYSTILENVAAAKEAGLELLGSTDHFSAMLYPDYENVRHYQYLMVSHTWPKEIQGIRVLQGCEVDIVDMEGNLFGFDIPILMGIFIMTERKCLSTSVSVRKWTIVSPLSIETALPREKVLRLAPSFIWRP